MNITKLKKFIIGKLSSELSENLSYHGVNHTLNVLQNCGRYISRLKIPANEAYLLRTAVLMHDTGFLFTYDHHEDASKKFVREILPDWNYSKEDVDKICGMIDATKIPQTPGNLLEEIIGDSDLDYLGTDLFSVVSETLYQELLAFNKIKTRDEWNQIQIRFLSKHHYHTLFAKEHREPLKKRHLDELIGKSEH